MRDDTEIAWRNGVEADRLDPPEDRQINVPLLRKTLEHITAHPEEWDQESWAIKVGCGTSYCLAGHVVATEGHEIVWEEPEEQYSYHWHGPRLDVAPFTIQASQCIVDGKRREIANVATQALGLDHTRACELFSPMNSLRDLWAKASAFTDGEIQVPADLPADDRCECDACTGDDLGAW